MPRDSDVRTLLCDSRGGIILANVRVSQAILQGLTEEDCSVLSAIYRHRCLNAPLLCQYFYMQANADMEYIQMRIQCLVMRNGKSVGHKRKNDRSDDQIGL